MTSKDSKEVSVIQQKYFLNEEEVKGESFFSAEGLLKP